MPIFPKKLDLKISDMEYLFGLPEGTAVTAKFSKEFYLQGTIVSKANDATVKSVVIKASNRQGAIFTFTKISDPNGSFVYKGRITSRNNSDAFEILKVNDQYVLQKKDYHEIIAE